MKKSFREIKNLTIIFIAAAVSYLSVYVFVLPSDFSPSGVDGISTILYEITGINIGYFKLIINLPLMILAWILLKKRYVIYVCIFILFDSLGMIFLESINFYTFVPAEISETQKIGYRLISAIYSGVALGVCTGMMIKIGCSTGGIDIVASILNLKKPNFNTERIISIICYGVIFCSYFVYSDLSSILLSIIQIFVFEWTCASLLRKERYALEVKIITKEPEKIRDEILYTHQHSATILNAKGMFSENDYYMVVTVLSGKNIADFMNSMKKYPETFVYFSDGVRVQGDFHFGKNIGSRIDAY